MPQNSSTEIHESPAGSGLTLRSQTPKNATAMRCGHREMSSRLDLEMGAPAAGVSTTGRNPCIAGAAGRVCQPVGRSSGAGLIGYIPLACYLQDRSWRANSHGGFQYVRARTQHNFATRWGWSARKSRVAVKWKVASPSIRGLLRFLWDNLEPFQSHGPRRSVRTLLEKAWRCRLVSRQAVPQHPRQSRRPFVSSAGNRVRCAPRASHDAHRYVTSSKNSEYFCRTRTCFAPVVVVTIRPSTDHHRNSPDEKIQILRRL